MISCFCWYDGICLLASPSVSPSVRAFKPVTGDSASGVKELQLPRARSPSEGVSGTVERVEVAQTQQSRVEWLANQNKTSLEQPKRARVRVSCEGEM